MLEELGNLGTCAHMGLFIRAARCVTSYLKTGAWLGGEGVWLFFFSALDIRLNCQGNAVWSC